MISCANELLLRVIYKGKNPTDLQPKSLLFFCLNFIMPKYNSTTNRQFRYKIKFISWSKSGEQQEINIGDFYIVFRCFATQSWNVQRPSRMFKIDLPSINFAESRKVYRNPGESKLVKMADLVVELLLSNLGRPGYIHRLPRQVRLHHLGWFCRSLVFSNAICAWFRACFIR